MANRYIECADEHHGAARLDPDLMADATRAISYQAAQLVERLRRQLVRERKSFCFETVFSHPAKIDFLAEAKAAGYEIVLVDVHLENPALNQAHVLDNSSATSPSERVAVLKAQVPLFLADPLPEWAGGLLGI